MRNLFILFLVLCCALSGYFFYKMNGGQEPINAVVFGIGLAGIALSVIRNSSPKS